MNFSAKRNYHWINVAFATAIIFSICAVDARARADQAAAFVMKGHYEDEFAGKHNVAGSFIVNACGSNALVDLTLENGFRQVVGTDGHDSFDYNANGQASISFGRFPTQANGAQKLLWLMSVDDSELSTNLQNYPLSFFCRLQ